jgi:serine/threonine-protein kinase
MAEVFAGLNVRTGKRVALKWIRPALAATTEALARFRREAVAAGRIHHPNVVTVFDVVEHKSATWLVMELLEGETLSEILNRVERMDAEEAVSLLIPAMRGVAAAHAHGVVHRDLKPDNIFICRAADGVRREAKVLDFGVSKLSDESGVDQVSITVTGNLVGTPTYMAPEQVRGNKTVDPRSDVYSLGVVLYQMLAGRPPFQGQVYSALMIEIATMDPPRLRTFRPDLSVELEAIVHKAIARDLDKRYSDVSSLVHALEALIGVEPEPGVARMQALHSERIDIALPPLHATKGDTQTLELTRQRVRRTRVIVVSVGVAILAGIGIKMMTATRTTRRLEALQERSERSGGGSVTPQAPGAALAAPGRVDPAQAPSAFGATAPGVAQPGARERETAPGHDRRSGLEASGSSAPAAGALGAGFASPSHKAAHGKLTASKTDRTTDRTTDKPADMSGPVPRADTAAAAAPAASASPPSAPPSASSPPTTTPPTAPASRAGRITIGDF